MFIRVYQYQSGLCMFILLLVPFFFPDFVFAFTKGEKSAFYSLIYYFFLASPFTIETAYFLLL